RGNVSSEICPTQVGGKCDVSSKGPAAWRGANNRATFIFPRCNAHDHAVPDRFKIQIHSDHRIAAHGSRLLSHIPEGDLLRVVQLAFVSAASAADDIGDSRQKIADHIGPHDRLTAGNPEIFHDFFSLEGVGGGDEHGNPPSLIKHPLFQYISKQALSTWFCRLPALANGSKYDARAASERLFYKMGKKRGGAGGEDHLPGIEKGGAREAVAAAGPCRLSLERIDGIHPGDLESRHRPTAREQAVDDRGKRVSARL